MTIHLGSKKIGCIGRIAHAAQCVLYINQRIRYLSLTVFLPKFLHQVIQRPVESSAQFKVKSERNGTAIIVVGGEHVWIVGTINRNARIYKYRPLTVFNG